MEHAAPAEISRAQLWQWLHVGGQQLDDGTPLDFALFERAGGRVTPTNEVMARFPRVEKLNEQLDEVVRLAGGVPGG